MTEPARSGAADLAPPSPGRPGPHPPGWAGVRAAMILQAASMARSLEDLALAVRELRRPPDGDRRLGAALETAALQLELAQSWDALARGQNYDEAVLEAAVAEAYAQGVADCKAARRRLGVIDGGRAG